MRNDIPTTLDQIGLGAFIDALPDEVVVLDSGGILLATNKAWRDFCLSNGGDRSAYLGANYFEVCKSATGPSSAEAAVIQDGLRHTLETGTPFTCEYPCDSPTEKRWFEMTATRIDQNGGTFLAVQHRNITSRRREIDALDQAHIDKSMLAALVASTSDAIISYDLDGRITTWNRAAQELYGYRADEVIGQSLEILYPAGWPHPITHYRDQILAGNLRRFEATRLAKDGTPREVWISGAPIRDAEGAVVAVSNIHRDVSELRKAEKEREMLAREVVHRAKNMLTIVSSVQRQTARRETTLEGFHRSFGARIQALARSVDLLVERNWSSVDLRGLVGDHLKAFAAGSDHRIKIDGPEVRLAPQAVQALGLAIHELATNATKYGALSHDAGHIGLSWRPIDLGDGPGLQFSWHETGMQGVPGAPDRPSAIKGFGSSVLTHLAPAMLETRGDYRLDASGVCWQIRLSAPYFQIGA